MNKLIQVLFSCLFLLETGSVFLHGHGQIKTHRSRRNKKRHATRKCSWKPFRLRRNHLHARIKHQKRLKTKRKKSRRHHLTGKFQRQQKMHDDLPLDSISINYAELKVRRMLAKSELPEKNRIHAFNKIMKTLDRYEKNGHVTIPDMERIVSQEILSS